MTLEQFNALPGVVRHQIIEQSALFLFGNGLTTDGKTRDPLELFYATIQCNKVAEAEKKSLPTLSAPNLNGNSKG